ncbi:hypothetical protein GGI24_000922, partial [Coemansia furcata]
AGKLHSRPKALALALESIFPMLWAMQNIKATTIMRKVLLTAINSFKAALDRSTLIPLNFGMAVKAKTTVATKTDGKPPAQTKPPAKTSAPMSKGAKCHQKQAAVAKDMKHKLTDLKADLVHCDQAAANTNEAVPVHANQHVAHPPTSQGN